MIEYVSSEPSSEASQFKNYKDSKRQQKTPTNAQSRAKLALIKSKSKSKQNFLTDPQTSDHTQKSTSAVKIKIQILEEKLHKLNKQNSQLRQQIITLKANQFYTINEEKVKMAIHENQKLRQEISEIRKINQQLQIQNEFLQRQNKSLKDDLQKITSSNFRKSIDNAKSRGRQNTTKTIKKQGEGYYDKPKGSNQENTQPKNLHQYSSAKNRKKTIDNVKSNPNLIKYRAEEVSQFSPTQKNQLKDSQKEIRKIKNENDPARLQNEHFLKQFEKYEKQLCFNTINKNSINTYRESRGITQLQDQSYEQDENYRNTMQIPSRQSRVKRSKSKESSLQAILNKKTQMMSRKDRNYEVKNNQVRKNTDSHTKTRQRTQNDQNFMGKGNQAIRQSFNDQYLIGKAMKYSSPNHYTLSNQLSPNSRLNHEYASSRRYQG